VFLHLVTLIAKFHLLLLKATRVKVYFPNQHYFISPFLYFLSFYFFPESALGLVHLATISSLPTWVGSTTSYMYVRFNRATMYVFTYSSLNVQLGLPQLIVGYCDSLLPHLELLLTSSISFTNHPHLLLVYYQRSSLNW